MASTSTAHQCTSLDSDDFTGDDLLVSQILLALPLIVQQSEFYLGLPPPWPVRRKRSAVVSPPPPPPPPPPSDKYNESSPNTPFSLDSLPLSQSESDENINAKLSDNKASLDENHESKRLKIIYQLKQKNRFLGVELKEQQYNHLKTINSELQEKKQEVIPDSKNKSTNLVIGTSNSAMNVAEESHLHQYQPPIKNPTAEQSNGQSFRSPNWAIPGYDPAFGPKGIPDLNVSFEEVKKMQSRVKAAEARQNRMRIRKAKNKNYKGAAKI